MEVDFGVVPPGLPDSDGTTGAVAELAAGEKSPKPGEPTDPSLAPAPGRGNVSEAGEKGNNSSCSSQNNNNSCKKPHRRGKNKGGKRHHRQWKPYSKMSWEERKALEERETRRACQKREKRFASGQPMAPYNTTQFLMEQHEPSDVDLAGAALAPNPPVKRALNKSAEDQGGSGGSASADPSSDEYYSSPDDEEIFLEKEFTEAYENYHAERLFTLNKDELVREHLELESKVERLEKQSREQQLNGRLSSGGEEMKENKLNRTSQMKTKDIFPTRKTHDSEIRKLKEEIQKLREENDKLIKDNQDLRQNEVARNVNNGEP